MATALPGMEIEGVDDGTTGPITASALTTIAALRDADLVEPRHELTVQLVVQLARAVDRGLHAPRVSVATATLSKHLLEAIESLPQPVENVDVWDAFQQELAKAAAQ